MYNIIFLNKIAELSYDHFKSLPKTGKPNSQEWTVLATILQYNSDCDKLEVVSLGTGSKCIGANSMSFNGDVINDSHAEIICRRAFIRYIYYQIESNGDIFENIDGKYLLRSNISFHFFTTHVPCGDAAIFPKSEEEFGECIYEVDSNKVSGKKRPQCDEEFSRKKLKMDLFRTGAKCVPTSSDTGDSKLPGLEYHVLGSVRTKPGRGDPTLSVSCSDKIAKWSFMGVQGALLCILLQEPIYLKSITIAGEVPFSEEAFQRALYNRFNCLNVQLQKPFHHVKPFISQVKLAFDFSKCKSKQPCPSSMIWCRVPFKPLEVSVNGRKQGITKKNLEKRNSRLLICKKELFHKFMSVISKTKLLNSYKTLSYKKMKEFAIIYNEAWNIVKNDVFQIWTRKESTYLDFVCSDVELSS